MEENPEVKALSKLQAEAVIDLALKGLSDTVGKTDAEIAGMVGEGLKSGIEIIKKLSGGGEAVEKQKAPGGVLPAGDMNEFLAGTNLGK